ncbi:hypothetical protein ACIQVC_16630 [Streptomyces sp. NPDC101112]|uniref:hypothetical protein n=1 Tax=Streptomyces sp. NPDC101112 TaxID=3366105 RepID=UPI0038202CCC
MPVPCSQFGHRDRFANNCGHDTSRVQEGAYVQMEWTKECMAAHGWYWQEMLPDQP